jgi:hypothetical protein
MKPFCYVILRQWSMKKKDLSQDRGYSGTCGRLEDYYLQDEVAVKRKHQKRQLHSSAKCQGIILSYLVQ